MDPALNATFAATFHYYIKDHFLKMLSHKFLDPQPITRTSFVISKELPHLQYKEQHGMHTAE